MNVRIVAITTAIIMIANLILFILGRLNPLSFWFITALCALIAYKGIPRLRNSK